MRKVLRYLAGTMELVLELSCGDSDDLVAISDSSWASTADRKSTSGCVLMFGSFIISAWSKTQSVIALSSAEAELIALAAAGTYGKFVQSLLQELGEVKTLTLATDSTAAIGVVRRRGPGRIRHLDIRELWIQNELRQGSISIMHIPGISNVADIFTKPLPSLWFSEFRRLLGLHSEVEGRLEAIHAITDEGQTQQPLTLRTNLIQERRQLLQQQRQIEIDRQLAITLCNHREAKAAEQLINISPEQQPTRGQKRALRQHLQRFATAIYKPMTRQQADDLLQVLNRLPDEDLQITTHEQPPQQPSSSSSTIPATFNLITELTPNLITKTE